MDKGLTPMRTTRKEADENTNEINGYENWTRNAKPNRNDHMDETEIIILKCRNAALLSEIAGQEYPGHHLPVKIRCLLPTGHIRNR
jgi:hypothetical protein